MSKKEDYLPKEVAEAQEARKKQLSNLESSNKPKPSMKYIGPEYDSKLPSPNTLRASLVQLLSQYIGDDILRSPDLQNIEQAESLVIDFMVNLAPEKFKAGDAPSENGNSLWSNGWNEGINKFIANIRGEK